MPKHPLQQEYEKRVLPEMKKLFGYSNAHAVPKLAKVTVHVGTGKALQDDKLLAKIQETLRRITGQQPVLTRAKKSIAAFKIRQGMVVGTLVTLRKRRMYDFVHKLINITLPRVRDFRGISTKSLDQNGNLTIGLQEHTVFPEIQSDEVSSLHGLEVVINTTAGNRDVGLALLRLLGFPFKKVEEPVVSKKKK